MGDEERSDSGAARYSLIHCVSDTDNTETLREREEGESVREVRRRNKGIHEYLEEQRRDVTSVQSAGLCDRRFISWR